MDLPVGYVMMGVLILFDGERNALHFLNGWVFCDHRDGNSFHCVNFENLNCPFVGGTGQQ
jgi:hypothetical protein